MRDRWERRGKKGARERGRGGEGKDGEGREGKGREEERGWVRKIYIFWGTGTKEKIILNIASNFE